MKRSTSDNPALPKYPKMPPGFVDDSVSSYSTERSVLAHANGDDYASYLSDVVVVGAGPAGLMLAYVNEDR